LDKKYTIIDHKTGEKYDVTQHEESDTEVKMLDPSGYPIYRKNTAIPITEAAKLYNQQTKSTDELLAEAHSLIEYNNRNKQETKQEPVKKKEEGTVQELLRLLDTY
jgi:hypothetical protein